MISEQNAQSPNVAKISDAFTFLDKLKEITADKPQIFKEFKVAVKAFKNQSISGNDLISQMKQILKEYDQLMKDFNQFVPQGCKIEFNTAATPVAAATPVTPRNNKVTTKQNYTDDSGSFLYALCEKLSSPMSSPVADRAVLSEGSAGSTPSPSTSLCGGSPLQSAVPSVDEMMLAKQFITLMHERIGTTEPEKFKTFLDILDRHSIQQMHCLQELLSQLLVLLADHQDLFLLFVNFLPPAIREQAKNSVKSSPERDPSAVDGTVGQPSVGQKRGYEPYVLPPGDPAVPQIVGIIGSHSTLVDTIHTPNAVTVSNTPSLPSIPSSLGSKVLLPAAAAAPNGAVSSSTAQNGAHEPCDEDKKKVRAFQYVFKIRDQLASDPDTYQAFLKVLRMHRAKPMKLSEMLNHILPLLSRYPELLNEFTAFLPAEGQGRARDLIRKKLKV